MLEEPGVVDQVEPGLLLAWGLRLTLAAALLYLASQLGTDLHGSHLFRQALAASNIERMVEHGLLHAPGAYNAGLAPLYDFPLFQGLAAALAIATGCAGVTAARVLGLCIFVLSLLLLRRWLRAIEVRPQVRMLTLLWFCAAPIQLFYSSAPVPDGLACLLAMLVLFAWKRAGRAWALAVFAAAFAATLIKPPVFLPAALALAILGLREQGWAACRSRQVWVPAAGAVAGLLAFVLISAAANAPWEAGRVYGNSMDLGYWYFSNAQDRLDPELYERLGKNIWRGLLNPLTLLCALVGVLRGPRPRTLLGPWLVGGLVTALLFFNVHWRHDYYQLPLVVPLCYFAALGADQVLRRSGRWRTLVLALLLLATAGFSVRAVAKMTTRGAAELASLQAAGRFIRAHTSPGDFVIYPVSRYDAQPQHLYFARREGLVVDTKHLDNGLLARVRGQVGGVRRVVVFVAAPLRSAVLLPGLGLRVEGKVGDLLRRR